MKTTLDYPPKILIAFGEAIVGNEKIMDWLINNGYPELAAFASAIRGSEDAIEWLRKHHPVWAILDAAIDNQVGALVWLRKNGFDFELKFAGLCNKQEESVKYFQNLDLKMFIYLAEKINFFRDGMVFDVHRRPKV